MIVSKLKVNKMVSKGYYDQNVPDHERLKLCKNVSFFSFEPATVAVTGEIIFSNSELMID